MASKRTLSACFIDEVACGSLLFPLARANLRAPVRGSISTSDVSEQAGSAEAFSFLGRFDTEANNNVSEATSAANEPTGRLCDGPKSAMCGVCRTVTAELAFRGPGCGVPVCSVACYEAHRSRGCMRVIDAQSSVALLLLSRGANWGWSLLEQGSALEDMECDRHSLSMHGVVVFSPSGHQMGDHSKTRVLPRVSAEYKVACTDLRSFIERVESFISFVVFLCAAGRLFFLTQPYASPLWGLAIVQELLGNRGLRCEQVGSVGELWITHNFALPVLLMGVRAIRLVCTPPSLTMQRVS